MWHCTLIFHHLIWLSAELVFIVLLLAPTGPNKPITVVPHICLWSFPSLKQQTIERLTSLQASESSAPLHVLEVCSMAKLFCLFLITDASSVKSLPRRFYGAAHQGRFSSSQYAGTRRFVTKKGCYTISPNLVTYSLSRTMRRSACVAGGSKARGGRLQLHGFVCTPVREHCMCTWVLDGKSPRCQDALM